MPSVNQFLPFGVGPGDDATPQTEYLAATWRVEGWRSGILPHEQINKVLRQTSTIAAALAQVVADYTQQNVVDNGNVPAIVDQIKLAISANLPYIEGFNYPVGSLGWAIQSGLAGGVMTAEEIREALTGSLTAEEFSSVINGRLNLIDAPTTGLVTKVADLTTAYGSTVSAATSATNAAQSAVAAALSQANALVYANGALASENSAASSATTATTKASEASASATQAASSSSSAAGSASTASTAATTATNASNAAGTSASSAATNATAAAAAATDAVQAAQASQTAATSANTSAASAQTSSTTASGAATTAQGAAATATTQANLAATSASNAASSASSAATSASSASTSATSAGQSASSATTAANTASTRASEAATSANAAAGSASTASSASSSAGSSATAANASAVSASASANSASNSAGAASGAASGAAASASSAATSASNASASATAAEQSAQASQSARIAAETAQAAASNSATQAAQAITTAQNSAASASTSATTAANASSSAGSSATAANNSAASASASANSANNSSLAAADWYNQTVSATGSLSAQVVQEANTRASQIAGVHAQLVFKTVATRGDGKRVLGAIGLASTAPNDATGGQSEILMQADRLVFVPSSDVNVDPKRAFVVGSVNGATTLVVDAAMIGDLSVRSAAIIDLDAAKITSRSITADKIALAGGTVAYASNDGVFFSPTSGIGGGGSYSSIGASSGQDGGYTLGGNPVGGKLLGTITVPFDGQTIHASVSGFLSLAFGSNWGGPGEALHGTSAQIIMSIYRVSGGSALIPVTASATTLEDITYLHPNKLKRIPFTALKGIAGLQGTYVAILTVNVNMTQGAGTSQLFNLNPGNCTCPLQFHMFANGV